jgi:hypothetical protein
MRPDVDFSPVHNGFVALYLLSIMGLWHWDCCSYGVCGPVMFIWVCGTVMVIWVCGTGDCCAYGVCGTVMFLWVCGTGTVVHMGFLAL